MHSKRLGLLLTGALALVFCFFTSIGHAQGLTSAALSGFVADKDGKAVVGATVTVVNALNGARYTAKTRSGGEYTVSGLAPGGPYSITAESGTFAPEVRGNVNLEVGAATQVNFVMGAEVVRMEAMTVEESRDTTFGSGAMGTGLTMDKDDILQVETIRRDVQDLENLDPRVVMFQGGGSSDPSFQLSAQGQNFRENSFMIDGVNANDTFGLNSNSYSGLRNPVPPEWIGSLSFDLTPYDIVNSGFLGAALNTTLKTGTNEFHGAVYEIYTGTNFRGADPVPNPLLGQHESLNEHTTGVTLGGPIIKNKVFFFFGYDAFRELATSSAQLFNTVDNSTDASVISQIVSTSASKYNYVAGTLAGPNHIAQQNAVGKITWNISDAHKFDFTFRHTDGQAPTFVNYTFSNGTSFSNAWYNSHRVDQSYAAKLTSNWSSIVPNLSSEIEGSYRRYNGTAFTNGSTFPAVIINSISGTTTSASTGAASAITGTGDVILGNNNSYQLNNLHTSELEEHAFGVYSVGAHTLKFGGQADRTEYENTFVQNYTGTFAFANVAQYMAGTPSGALIATPTAGFKLSDAIAHYALTDYVALVQDIWHPTNALTVTGGIRLDYPYQPGKPIVSQLFIKAYGYPNNATMNGNDVVSPRLGFTYTFPTKLKTQLRGGAGLFLGQNPAVWLENSFANAGQLTQYSAGSTSSNTAAPIANYTFTGNPATQALPPVAATVPVPTFNVTDKNFHWPSSWKGNIALDKELPFLGLIATVEGDWTKVNKDIYYRNLNYGVPSSGPAFMPDGAIRYAGNISAGTIPTSSQVAGYSYVGTSSVSGSTVLRANQATGPVYWLGNTDQGGSQEYTINLKRPMKDNWAFSASYSHTHATQVESTTSSVAQSNFTGQAYLNPGDNRAYISDYEVPDKIVLTASRQFHFFSNKQAATILSAQFIAETGHPYSFVFAGDADGSGISGRNLFYVPTGPSDPKVAWASPTEEANFFNFLGQNPSLAQFAGQVVPRNSAFSPWERFLNLHFEQRIPTYGGGRVTLFADCFDFLNLLNRNWGQVAIYDFPYSRSIAGTLYNAAGNGGAGQYIYVFNATTLGTTTFYPDMSRWNIQIGARIEF